jgi:hypothetical protein
MALPFLILACVNTFRSEISSHSRPECFQMQQRKMRVSSSVIDHSFRNGLSGIIASSCGLSVWYRKIVAMKRELVAILANLAGIDDSVAAKGQ